MERKVKKVHFINPVIPKRKRVAAYARVSSAKDAMHHSLSAQVSYYSAMIQSRGEWEYAGVYADEAKTGTKDSRQDLIDTCNRLRTELADTTLLDEQSSALLDETNLLTEMIKKLIEQNASTAMNQEEYARKYNDYAARFEKVSAEYEKLQKQKLRRLHQSDILETFAFEIFSLPDLPIEFSDVCGST